MYFIVLSLKINLIETKVLKICSETSANKIRHVKCKGQRHWDFWCCGFRYFLDRFWGFNVHCGLRIFRFLAFGFRILVKNNNRFSNLVSDVVLGFFLFPVPVSHAKRY